MILVCPDRCWRPDLRFLRKDSLCDRGHNQNREYHDDDFSWKFFVHNWPPSLTFLPRHCEGKSKTDANGPLDFAFYSVGEIIVAADLMYGFSCKGLPYVSFPILQFLSGQCEFTTNPESPQSRAN